MKKIISLISLCLLCVFAYAEGIVEVKGRITDEEGKAIANAELMVRNTTEKLKTDANGVYKIALPEGKYVVKVSKVSYGTKTVIIELNANTELDVSLEKIKKSETSRI